MKKKHLALVTIFFLLALAVAVCFPEIKRLYAALYLFDEASIAQNFRSIDALFSRTTVHRAGEVYELKKTEWTLPDAFVYQGATFDTDKFISDTMTTGLIVLQEDTIYFEDYYLGNSRESKCISWSVAKSFLSALYGIALDEGKVTSIEDPITRYVPELIGSGYDGVRIKDALQMSSGVMFDEDYADFFSDINRMGRILALGGSLDDFVASIKPDREPGTYNKYISTDTQALAMILVRVYGKSLSALLEEKLWSKLGMLSDAYYIADTDGMELALGGLNCTLQDYARFGLLYLNEGNWNGQQLVPKDWVRASVTPDAPHLMPGENPASDDTWGYAYQWWIPEESDGDYLAVGIYNQFIWVYPKKRIVIAKTSAYANYTNDYESEPRTVAFFRAIADALPEPKENSPASSSNTGEE